MSHRRLGVLNAELLAELNSEMNGIFSNEAVICAQILLSPYTQAQFRSRFIVLAVTGQTSGIH
jgi:hypothetical protein